MQKEEKKTIEAKINNPKLYSPSNEFKAVINKIYETWFKLDEVIL